MRNIEHIDRLGTDCTQRTFTRHMISRLRPLLFHCVVFFHITAGVGIIRDMTRHTIKDIEDIDGYVNEL